MLAQRATADYPDDTTWQSFSVSYSYPVCFTQNLFAPNNPTLLNTLQLKETNKQHRIIVFIDEGVVSAQPNVVHAIDKYVSAYHRQIKLVCSPLIMVSGEKIKSDERYMHSIQQAVAEHRIDRHSFVIGIGGGALLDAVGLVAATAHRGIRHIRIPTTVLAQNDSGVGVKNSINQFKQKNYLGSFAPPFAVLNDYHFIDTLQNRDKIAGMSEAVKVALIRDKTFYHWLQDNATALASFDEHAMRYMIKRCAELHMHQIANGGDPFETGSARPLDFGHWAAHRLESLTHYKLRHGEAVALGIALDTRYAVLSGLLQAGTDTHVCQLLETLGFKLWHPELTTRTDKGDLAVVQGLTDFKEHLGGELTITLLEGIGKGIEVHEIDEALVARAIEWMKLRAHPPTKLKVFNSALSQHAGPDVSAVATCLHQWLEQRLSAEQSTWFNQRLSLLQDSPTDRDLHITLGLIPRKLGHDDLDLNAQQIAEARQSCAVNWDPCEWTIDNAARCLVLITIATTHPTRFHPLFNELCATAELNEAIAFYRCIAVLPAHAALDQPIGTGLRTHIRAIFESIAHRNPYPAANFDQHRWNHMVLKALFIDSQLWPIQGLEQRANAELASILCDYAHERWAAKRRVTPELWRCVGPHAKGAMLDDLYRVIQSQHAIDQQAGLLALMSAPGIDQQQVRTEHSALVATIEQEGITWESIGQEFGSTLSG